MKEWDAGTYVMGGYECQGPHSTDAETRAAV